MYESATLRMLRRRLFSARQNANNRLELARGRESHRPADICSEGLFAIERQIPEISKEIGSRYLASSSLLERLTTATDSLVRGSAALVALAGEHGQGAEAMERTVQLLAPIFAYLNSWQSEVEKRVAELNSCAQVFATVQSSEGTLRELISPLSHMQTMFRIEAATLPENVRQIFAGLSAEIEKIHHGVAETFGKQFAVVTSALQTLEEAKHNLSVQVSDIRHSVDHQQRQTATALDNLRSKAAQAAQSERQLAEASRCVAEAASRIVMALQVDDITSQRLDAVKRSLTQARELLADADSSPHRAWGILRIQIEQVRAVRRQIEEAEKTLQRDAAAIHSQVDSLNSECRLIQGFELVAHACSGSADVSLAMMDNTRSLTEGVLARSQEFANWMRPLRELTSGLTGVLENLSNQMHLVALNAQVQAVQIGEGTGLEVLAAHTAEISTETSAVAEKVPAAIAEVVSIVKQLLDSFTILVESGREMMSTFELKAAAQQESMQQLRQTSLDRVEAASSAISDIRACAESLASESTVRQTALVHVDNAIASLERVQGNFEDKYGRLDASVLTELETRGYRMKAERDVHALVLSSMREAAPEGVQLFEEPAEAANPELQVELF